MGLGTLSLLFPTIAMSYGWRRLADWDGPSYEQACRVVAAYPQLARPYLAERPIGFHSGSYFFEGIRIYGREGGEAAFRLFWEESERPRTLPRSVAYYGLGATRRREALPKLRALVADPEWRVAGIDALGWHGAPESIPLLAEFLDDSERVATASGLSYVGDWAANALAEIGLPALPVLHRAAGDPYSAVRKRAVRAIGQIGSPLSADILAKIVRQGRQEPAYYDAVYALAKVGDARAIEPLRALVESEGVWEASEPGLIALRRHPKVWQALRREAEKGSDTACIAYARAGGTDLRILWERGLKGERQRFYAKGLAELRDPRSIPALVGVVGENGDEVRFALAAMGKPACAPLRRLLASPNRRVRDEAACALGLLGDFEVIPLLKGLPKEDGWLLDEVTQSVILANVARQVPPYRSPR